MNIWRVDSDYASRYILAEGVIQAVAKYTELDEIEKIAKSDPEAVEVTSVQFIGEVAS